MADKIDEAAMVQRAERCWALMDKNEETAVRIGLNPHWVVQEDLGGRAMGEGFPAIKGEFIRLLAVALGELARNNGGTIA